MESKSELPDHHTYSEVSFYPDTFRFYLEAVKFYEQLLSADLAVLDKDPDLALILDEETRKSFKIHHEVRRVRRVREWIEAIIQE